MFTEASLGLSAENSKIAILGWEEGSLNLKMAASDLPIFVFVPSWPTQSPLGSLQWTWTKRARSFAYLLSSKHRAEKWQWIDPKTRWYCICSFNLQYAVKTNLLCHKTVMSFNHILFSGWLVGCFFSRSVLAVILSVEGKPHIRPICVSFLGRVTCSVLSRRAVETDWGAKAELRENGGRRSCDCLSAVLWHGRLCIRSDSQHWDLNVRD